MRNTPIKTIFVAGIHGSGKGYLCREIASRGEWSHVTASSLIKRAICMGAQKQIHDASRNQSALIQEYQKLDPKENKILLDGHFCLLNQEGGVECLPIKVFQELTVDKVILVTCCPTVVYRRLMDRNRSTHNQSINDIEGFQNQETAHAKFVANTLSLPLLVLNSERGVLDSVVEFIQS